METTAKQALINDIKVNEPQTVGKVAERKISTNYTIQRFRGTIETLVKAKLVKQEEKEELVKIYNNLLKREIGEELKL